MYSKVAAKLDSGEELDQADRIFLHIITKHPEWRGVISLRYVGQRAQRAHDWYFEAKRSRGWVLVKVAFEIYHPRFEEIIERLCDAITDLRGTSSSTTQRMRIKP